MLNNTHCSSSQEFDEVSKTLRTVALAADTTTAARISHDKRLPIQVLMASITRVAGSNALSTASRRSLASPLCSAVRGAPASILFLLYVPTAWPRAKPAHLNPMPL